MSKAIFHYCSLAIPLTSSSIIIISIVANKFKPSFSDCYQKQIREVIKPEFSTNKYFHRIFRDTNQEHPCIAEVEFPDYSASYMSIPFGLTHAVRKIRFFHYKQSKYNNLLTKDFKFIICFFNVGIWTCSS